MILFDRFMFAFTIASHITLVVTSIALIITIVLAEFLSIRRNDSYFANLAKRLTRAFTISFGVGTASGIVMAIELVTLFPGLMTVAGQTGVITLFYFEVFAFFLETLFLVLYVYYANAFKGRFLVSENSVGKIAPNDHRAGKHRCRKDMNNFTKS